MAVAAHPEYEYICIEAEAKRYIGVKATVSTWAAQIQAEPYTEIWTQKGKAFEGWTLCHPLPGNGSPETRPVLMADFISQEDGTGFVHIAPGHGQDDYDVWKKTFPGKPFVMPVDDQGKLTNRSFNWLNLAGKPIFEANKDIGQAMQGQGTLFKLSFIKHSYPHCWRCKDPVIFRATPQWFVKVDGGLRKDALSQIDQTTWFPDWGHTRISTMVENRPDWCISRQRSWGIPIPAYICQDCGHAHIGGDFHQNVVDVVQKSGSQVWFTEPLETFLPPNASCANCSGTRFKKESNILDVWFESGASFASVLLDAEGQPKPGFHFPADLYLEGSDQHRGWFQSSLLIGVGATGKAPYKSVLTHGFLIDDKGRKMSKSLGNVVSPQDIIKDFGADVLRWWVASSDFKNDLAISQNILKQCQDSFSKVRNTIRFCLSNLFDFNLQTDSVEYSALNSLDQWALQELNRLIQTCRTHLEGYAFHHVTQAIHHFCAVTLSSMYLDMVKDRLYCSAPAHHDRRSTQTVLWHLAECLIRLCSPIIVFTAEDAYAHFKGQESRKTPVHHLTYPIVNPDWENPELAKKMAIMADLKDQVYQLLEPLRAQKEIKSFLEAAVVLPEIYEGQSIRELSSEWTSFLLVSQVTFHHDKIHVSKTTLPKCERCWRHISLSTDRICHRCEEALLGVEYE
jgi:isoleucyl-tRNA synthetase